MRELFIKPGDLFLSKDENMHFHRGMKYAVRQCYQKNGRLIVTMTDKWGDEVPCEAGSFEATDKMRKDSVKRKLRAKLNFCWEHAELMAHSKKGWFDFDNIDMYELSKSRTGISTVIFGSGPKDGIAHLRRYKFTPEVGINCGGRSVYDPKCDIYFKSIEQYYAFFEKLLTEDDINYHFGLPHTRHDAQQAIDMMQFIADENYATPGRYDTLTFYDRNMSKFYEMEAPDFLMYLSELIFDKRTLSGTACTAFLDIVTLFVALPASHGSTSVAKVLNGTSKVKNDKIDPNLVGKYKDKLKYDQIFELVDAINRWLWQHDVFVEKERYGSGDEWRGTFEYVGSKYIDKDKLKKLLQR